jgi:hypothetical protein
MRTPVPATLLALPLLAIVLALNGCTSLPGNGALTLRQTEVSVSWKMTAYRQAALGDVTEAQTQRVTANYQAYQLAFKQALASAGNNLDAPTPPALQSIVQELVAAIDDVLATVT